MAAVDYFLKIDGVEGESTDKGHPNQIDILSFSWGASNTSNVAHGGGAGAGKVSMQDFHFTMAVNKASPKLMRACATGQHFPKATLVGRKAGGQQQDFLKYSLSDVLVSSYQTAGDGSVVPSDQFTLNFLKIEFAVNSQRADGSVTPVETNFDLRTNQAG